MGKQKLDFHETVQKAKEDEKILHQRNIKAPDLAGRPRLRRGKAIFFYTDENKMKHSVVHKWDQLRLNQGF